ncbi:MAG: hypothetical protein CM15mP60_1310 [Alphaproteobacteria bacterium]|nr:MAG: hypothetical protein CM15mP60_1310 [Alphaproteobacteria bacterium]
MIASWIRYVAGTDEAGQPIDVRDPMADHLKLAATSADPVKALLSIEAIFGPDLAGNADVVAAIQSATSSFKRRRLKQLGPPFEQNLNEVLAQIRIVVKPNVQFQIFYLGCTTV